MEYIPGVGSKWMDVRFEGGTFDGKRQSHALFHHSEVVVSDDPATIRVAVHNKSGETRWFLQLRWSPADEKSFDESERYARRLARSWHLEEYVFSHFDKPSKWRRKVPVYRFARALSVTAVPGDRRWTLEVGAEIPLRPGETSMTANLDSWDIAYRRVEEACDRFHRIVALIGEGPLSDALHEPRRAVESSRAEAKRLAALGQQLEGVDDPKSTLAATAERVSVQLDELHDMVVEAVRLAADLQLDAACATPDLLRGEGTAALHALRDAVDELSVRS